MTDKSDEALRIREDQERDKYVRLQVRRIIKEGLYEPLIRAAINSAWINGRNQILTRSKEKS